MKELKLNPRKLCIPLVMSGLLLACSDAPRQYGRETPPSPTGFELPDADKLEASNTNLDGEVKETLDEITRRVTRQPIVYGKGAGGITFETEFSAGQRTLPKPTAAPDAEGWAEYPAGIVIQWRQAAPLVPKQIFMNTNYLGEFKIGGRFGSWKLFPGQDLSAYFNEDASGRKLVRELYNTLEAKDSDFDCFKASICHIRGVGDPSQENILIEWNKLILAISKDRKVLFEMGLFDAEPIGRTNANFDIAQGRFEIPASDKLPAASVEIGQSWGDILRVQGQDAKTETTRNALVKTYLGAVLGISRSQFERTYKEPSAQESLNFAAILRPFSKELRLNGQRIEIVRDSNGKIGVVRSQKTQGNELLRLDSTFNDNDHFPLLKSLLVLIGEEMKDFGPIAIGQAKGQHKPLGPKNYTGFVGRFDPTKGEGRVVSIRFLESLKSLASIRVARLRSEADRRIIPALATTVKAGAGTAAGFMVGETFPVSEADIGRAEATVQINNGKVRATYKRDKVVKLAFEGQRLDSKAYSSFAIGEIETELLMVPTAKDKSNQFQVVAVTSPNQRISGLCGIESLGAGPGDSERDLLKRIKDAVSAQKTQKSDFSCNYFAAEDANSTGRFEAIYFPDQGVKIEISNGEFASITVYKKNEVKP